MTWTECSLPKKPSKSRKLRRPRSSSCLTRSLPRRARAQAPSVRTCSSSWLWSVTRVSASRVWCTACATTSSPKTTRWRSASSSAHSSYACATSRANCRSGTRQGKRASSRSPRFSTEVHMQCYLLTIWPAWIASCTWTVGSMKSRIKQTTTLWFSLSQTKKIKKVNERYQHQKENNLHARKVCTAFSKLQPSQAMELKKLSCHQHACFLKCIIARFCAINI